MRRYYTPQYGTTQEQIYKRLRDKGYSEKFIQELYKIPQASLRRCRHHYNKRRWKSENNKN